MPRVESFGVEPVPAELRAVGWRDLFALQFNFTLTPLYCVFGALAVTQGGLPLWWAVGTNALGSGLGSLMVYFAARPSVDEGVPGQVAMRATFGQWGSRLLTSPYRMIAATYWFAAQALAGALGFQAIFEGLTGKQLRLVPIALVVAAIQGLLAIMGFDYLVLQRGRLDVPALYAAAGRYRYLGGINAAAVCAVGAGVAVYCAVPTTWLKMLWGAGVAGVALLVLEGVQTAVAPHLARQAAPFPARGS